LLLEHARSYAEAQVVFGAELTTFEQDEEGVSATIIDRPTGDTTLVRAHYVVTADGVYSRIREQLGIAMQGPDHLANFLSILFRADLKGLLGGRVHGLYFIRHPQAPGVFVPTSTDGRWNFGMEWHPEQGERLEDYHQECCITLVRMAAGMVALDVELVGVQAFTFAAQVARRYGKGNVFLAGDAAHCMTPSGGMGMNTGIHDAHNLAWKLAAVLKGWADPRLLSTYESERRPVGLRNTKRSDTRLSIGRREGEARQQEGDEASWSDLEIDLGYCYESTAIIAESPAENGHAPALSRFTCRPGRRAPHIWLARDGKRISTLDLYDRALTLLTGSAGAAWRKAADTVTTTHGVPLAVHIIGPESELCPVDPNWEAACGIESDGALLVRPDGFVAWRQRGTVRDPQTVLSQVVEQIVGRSTSQTGS
jgi:putative polyketide hydroxylase